MGSSNVGSPDLEAGKELLANYIQQAQRSPNPEDAFPNFEKAQQIYGVAVGEAADLLTKYQEKNEEPNHGACPMPIPGKTELPFAAFILSTDPYKR